MSAFSENSFTADDYYKSRPQYPLSLFDYIYRFHQSQQQARAAQLQQQHNAGVGGASGSAHPGYASRNAADLFNSLRQTTRALDIACGPGEATVPLSRYFDEVVGIDPSEVMIQSAKRAYTVEYPKVTFVTGSAEEFVNASIGGGSTSNIVTEDIFLGDDYCDSTSPQIQQQSQPKRASFKVAPNSVDFISAAEGAHWFDLDKFYYNASLALKPGGTLAIWGYCNHIYTEPGNPYQLEKAAEIQNLYLYSDEHLGPYWQQPGRDILQDRMVGFEPQSMMYQQPPSGDGSIMPSNTRFIHVERHDNVATSRYPKLQREKSSASVPSKAFIMRRVVHLLDVVSYLKTSSAYYKWKSANAGAPYDPIDKMMDEIKEVTGWTNSTLVTIEYDTFLILATKEF